MDFQLEASDLQIDEIVITGDVKKAIRVRDGNMVLDPSYLGDLRASSTFQLMSNIPSVDISSAGITINGQPAGLKINNRNIGLSSSATNAYLQAIPAEMIKEIVVVSSSSANSASDTGGVVNVILKEEEEDSHSLSVGGQLKLIDKEAAGYSSGFYTRQQGNSYFSLFLNYENEYFKRKEEQHTVYSNDGSLDALQWGKTRGNTYFGVANYDYSFGNQSVLHLNGSFFYGDRQPRYDYAQNYTRANGTTEKVTDMMSLDDKGDLFEVYADYKTADSLPLKHDVGYGIVWGKAHVLSDNYSSSAESMDRSEIEIKNRHYGFQHQFHYDLTYTKEKLELMAGTKLDLGTLHPSSHYYSIIDNQPVQSDLFSSKYDLQENVYAAYASARYRIEPVSVTLGLRGEITDMTVGSVYEKADWNYKKEHLFPFAKINGNFGLVNSTLSLSSGIERPPYPFYTPDYRYRSKYSYSTGNPNLLPVRSYKVGLENLLFDFIDLDFAYTRNKGIYGSITYSGEGDFEEITTYRNYADENRFTVNLYLPYLLVKNKISGYLAFYGEYSKLTNCDERLNLHNKKGQVFTISNSTQYSITKDFRVGYFFRYQGPYFHEQDELKALHSLDLNASYTYKRFTFGVQAYDIFDKRIFQRTSYYVDNITNLHSYRYNRQFAISIRYDFMKGKKINERENKGADASRFQ
jgi:hypothetical protein